MREYLGADPGIVELFGDRLYPGELPPDEAETPLLFYEVPETIPFDTLDGVNDWQRAQFVFHSLADSYAEAKAGVDAIFAAFDAFQGGQISEAHWLGTTEDTTDEGYHHTVRFDVWGPVAGVVSQKGARSRITTSLNAVTLTAGVNSLTVSEAGLFWNGAAVPTSPPAPPDLTPYAQKAAANVFTTGPQTMNTGGTGNAAAVFKAAAGQSANLTEWQSSTGGVFGYVDSQGRGVFGGTNTANQLGFGNFGSGFPEIARMGGSGGLYLRSVNPLIIPLGALAMREGDNQDYLKLLSRQSAAGGQGRALVNTYYNPNAGVQGARHVSMKGNASQTDDFIEVIDGSDRRMWAISAAGNVTLWGVTSTSEKQIGAFVQTWADSTDATRKGRVSIYAHDWNGARECIRTEADGTGPRVGFLGASAVARPNVSGSRGGNAALASVLAALVALGLVVDSTTA